jgi:UDP-N-acetylmuramate dehydrogenase
MPVTWLGLGSNVLVRDGGIRGAVICTSGLPRAIERLDAYRVRAGAGVPCATLARRCARWKLGPAAFFAGIPGSVGGALAMNAGAYGAETWERVESVETIDRAGALRERSRAEFEVGYRRVAGAPGEWFVGAVFAFEPNRDGEAQAMKELLAARSTAQPLGRPNAGSVFRNPPGDFAGRLIEAAGLKGARRGGAVVSEKHANFIINEGQATAADVESLIETVRATVKERTGVLLELEVRVLGAPAGERP